MPELKTTAEGSGVQRRPGVISVLSILIFLSGLFHLVKFSQALIQWELLASLPITVSPLYLMGDGLFWAVSAGFLSWSLWSGKNWSRFWGILLSSAFTAVFWLDLIFLAEPGILQNRWPINLALTLAGLPGMILILNMKSSRAYFNRTPVKITS